MTEHRDLGAIARFADIFSDKDFKFGKWSESKALNDGVRSLPNFNLNLEATKFVQAAYSGAFIDASFDWPAWARTDEAIRLRDDPSALEAADVDQLSRLLTVVIRSDRFSEGVIAAAFESGLIARIVRRAAVLAAA